VIYLHTQAAAAYKLLPTLHEEKHFEYQVASTTILWTLQ
jgi:hypothetical protein